MLAIHESSQVLRTWRAESGQVSSSNVWLDWLEAAWVQHLTALLLLSVLGYFAQSVMVGMVLLGVYAVAAVILNIASENTFKVALVGLVALAVFTAFGLEDFTNIYAQYVFLLLCIGTLCALLEQWRGNHSFSFRPGQRAGSNKVVTSRRPANIK